MVLNKNNAEMRRLYSPAVVATQKICGQFATCSTCMYAAWPADYEHTGYNMYCLYVKTGKEGKE